jgi:hypothetical protein
MLNSGTLPDTSFSFMKQAVTYFLISCVFKIPYWVSKSCKMEKKRKRKNHLLQHPQASEGAFCMLSPYEKISYQIQMMCLHLIILEGSKNHCSLIEIKLWKMVCIHIILQFNISPKFTMEVWFLSYPSAYYLNLCFLQNTFTCSTSCYMPFTSNTSGFH